MIVRGNATFIWEAVLRVEQMGDVIGDGYPPSFAMAKDLFPTCPLTVPSLCMAALPRAHGTRGRMENGEGVDLQRSACFVPTTVRSHVDGSPRKVGKKSR